MAEKKLTKHQYLGDYINGAFVKSRHGDKYRSISPADLDDTILEWVESDSEHIDLVLEHAQKAYLSWSALEQKDRNKYLLKLAEVYKQNTEEIAVLIARETGKPLWESKQEANALSAKIKVTLEESLPLVQNRTVSQNTSMVKEEICYRSKGVFVVIGPFNFPMHLPNGQILSALACGNTVIFKPSELTPACGQIMAQCFHQAGFPKGVFNMVQGSGSIAQIFVQDELVDGVLFTGSYKTGKHIKKLTWDNPHKIVALEMGGKNSSIVWKSANVQQAVWEVFNGAYLTTGQRCSSTSQIILHPHIRKSFLDQFLDLTKKVKIGHWQNNPFMGPLINSKSVDNYLTVLQKAKNTSTASVLIEGSKIPNLNGYFVSPTVVENFYYEEELFAPLVSIYTTDSKEKVWELVNQSGYGLCLSVFAEEKDKTFVQQLFQKAKVGVFHWNVKSNGASSHLPFGGMGKSGNHQPAGLFAVLSCMTPVACRKKIKTTEFCLDDEKKHFFN